MKKCKKCNSLFSGKKCKKCEAKRQLQYYYDNKEKVMELRKKNPNFYKNQATYVRRYHKRHPEYLKEYQRKNAKNILERGRIYYKNNKEKILDRVKKYQKENAKERLIYDKNRDKFKMSARNKLRYAVMVGKIKKQPCEICGEIKTQGHHTDYSKPLDIMWLCTVHHGMQHRKMIK